MHWVRNDLYLRREWRKGLSPRLRRRGRDRGSGGGRGLLAQHGAQLLQLLLLLQRHNTSFDLLFILALIVTALEEQKLFLVGQRDVGQDAGQRQLLVDLLLFLLYRVCGTAK